MLCVFVFRAGYPALGKVSTRLLVVAAHAGLVADWVLVALVGLGLRRSPVTEAGI